MADRIIIVKNKEKLSERCIEVNVVENKDLLKEITDKMLSYLHKHEDCKSITANQLKYNVRVFGIRFDDGIKFFVNPMFGKQEGLHISLETNISFPNRTFIVARNDKVVLEYQDLFGLAGEATFEGPAADIIQQSVQLLDGVTLDDFGFEVFDDFLSATVEEQEEVVNLYLDNIKNQTNKINEEIDSDPTLSDTRDAIKFLTAAAKGEVQLDTPILSNRKKRLRDKLLKRAKNFGKKFTKKQRKGKRK